MDAHVEAAFAAVLRTGFLPEADRTRASYDGPIPIGHGQTNSQPRTVAAMLELLDVRPGQHVLDVGSGSGWTTALLAHLTGPEGQVRGVELVPDIATWGASNVAATDMPWASVTAAEPDVLGLPEHAPYDRILVSAEATELPQPLVAQLAVEGVLVVPVRGVMLRVRRVGEELDLTEHGRYSFVPLR